jgi:NAD(P)-dependent dehydrogenase (short-subunit alcohol dehydrogenase family)
LRRLPGNFTLVTGANQGIGVETARVLWMTGATVYLAVRDAEKGERVIQDMRASDPSNTAPLHMVELALDSRASVRAAANTFLGQKEYRCP